MQAPPAEAQALARYLWQARCAVLYDAWVQLRYQRRRQRFFDLAARITRAATVVLGASLLGQYLLPLVPWIGAAITALGLLALIFDYDGRRALHAQLAADAAALLAQVQGCAEDSTTHADIARWRSAYAALCARAPAPLKTLSLICAHEQSGAEGNPQHVALPSWWRRLLADFKS